MAERRNIPLGPLALAAAAILLAGCATVTSGLRDARESYRAGDYEKTAKLLEAELRSHPSNSEIRTLLFRAKLNNYYAHLALAREKRRANDRAAANREYSAALAVFPDNTALQKELSEYMSGPRPGPAAPFQSSIQPPITLDIKKDDKGVTLNLKNTPITSIFQTLGKIYGVSFVFDRDFRDFPHSVDIENSSFYEVLRVLCMVASAQYRVLDQHTALVYPDIFNKKKAYDLRGIKTFYLSDIKAEDALKLVQSVFRDEQLLIQNEPNLNALIVRGDINALQDVENFLRRVDKPRSEVELQIEILEINRNLYHKLGADIADGSIGVNAGALDTDGKVDSTVNFKDLKSTNFFLTIPSVTMNVLETDSDAKLIARPNLRGVDGEEISFQVGEEIPIPETQFQAIAAGGVNSSPVTTYKYRKVGVEVKVTPTIHSEGDVTLKIKMVINFVSPGGTSTTFPILGNREIENKIRLKEGETNLIGGLIRDDLQRSLSGIPALARIPILGRLFAADEKTVRQTDLLFSITPRVIRRAPVDQTDQAPIWTGTSGMALGGGAPVRPGEGAADRPTIPSPSTPEVDDEEESPEENQATQTAMITITPVETRVPANGEAFFSMYLRSGAPLASLSLSGSVQGGDCQVMEIRTDTINENEIKTMKNASGSHFDAGYSFLNSEGKPRVAMQLLQLRVKFPARGRYTLSLDQLTALGPQRNNISVKSTTTTIDVY